MFKTDVVYTIAYTLNQYIPAGGTITIRLPNELEIANAGGARSGFSSFGSSLSVQSAGGTALVLKANGKIPVGNHKVAFGGVRNPDSFAPTGLFAMMSTDH